MWNVGWGYDDWELTSTRDDAVQATISETHGVSAPNSLDHVVDLDIFAMCAATRLSPIHPLTPVPVHTRRKPQKFGEEYSAWKGWDWKVPDVGEYPGKYGWG